MLGWYRAHRSIVDNTSALVGTAAVTSGLGFAFWWVAARLFPAEAVGLASAAVSAMLLLSTMGIIGLDALVISEIPRSRGDVGRLVTTAVVASFVAAGALGAAFGIVAPQLSANLAAFFASGWTVLAFGTGVGLTGATFVLDRATVGFLAGGIQFRRNLWFAASKLVLLPALLLSAAAMRSADEAIFALWVATTLLSALLVTPELLRRTPLRGAKLDASLVRRLGGDALRHHMLNVAQHGPGLAMPVLVVALFSAEVGAAFYVTWMLITFAHVVPVQLTTVLHAVGVRDPVRLARTVRTTLRLSMLAALAASVGFIALATWVLRLFGPDYADAASAALRILALTAFPLSIKVHYFALARIHGFTSTAAVVGIVAGTAELLAAALGAWLGTLATMSWFLLGAMTIEALGLAPIVLRAARSPAPASEVEAATAARPGRTARGSDR
jgi:O-antigen/teichoic acid export membrane protein